MTNYLTIKDLQEKLHIGRNMAYSLAHTPGFPMVKIGQRYVISEEKLDEFLSHYYGKEIFLK